MSGDPDPLYVRARSALLDAADALEPHHNTIVLVGAQAVYLHTGGADFATAEYTTDAYIAIKPVDIEDSPSSAELLVTHSFALCQQPVRWRSRDGIYVDLMVPEALAGPGTRAARLGPHGKQVARRAKGLEASLVDHEPMVIKALDPADARSATMLVSGPGALLVAKVHKIAERTAGHNRIRDKDALDVLRLLQGTETADLASRLGRLLECNVSSAITTEAVSLLDALFGDREATGVAMAVRAAGASDPDTISASLTALVSDLLGALAIDKTHVARGALMDQDEINRRLRTARSATLGTVGESGRPHLVPIVFAYEDGVLYTAVDQKPKSTYRLRRLRNVESNPNVSVLVDDYHDDWSRLWWVRLDGTALVIRSGPVLRKGLDLLTGKYEVYTTQPPPGPVIEVRIERVRSWSAS